MIRYERDASFKYVKEVFQNLNHKDAQFVNPRGRFVDSPNVAIRYVAFDEDLHKPVGFIDGFVFEDAPDTVILVMAVLEKYRKQYVGSELLSYMERAASQDGYYRLLARIENDNLPSIRMTKKHGFTYDGPIDPDDPQVHMHKILRKGGLESMDHFVKMQSTVAAAFEAEVAKDADAELETKARGSIKSKFKAVGCRISGAFKSLVSKLKSIFQRKRQEETKSEPASELFGFGKGKTRDGNAALRECVEWVKTHSKEIMTHNDDKSFSIGVYNANTASDDFKNSVGIFINAKKTIQEQGYNFGSLVFNVGNDDQVILGFTYDSKNITKLTSVMFMEVVYSVPMSRLMDDDVKAFNLTVIGHLLWTVEDPDAPIGNKNTVVMIGSVSFSAK